MESPSTGALMSPATRVVMKVVIYYAILITVGWLVLNQLPTTPGLIGIGLDSVLGAGDRAKAILQKALFRWTSRTRAAAVAVAMTTAILLSLPVAWVYQLTRSETGVPAVSGAADDHPPAGCFGSGNPGEEQCRARFQSRRNCWAVRFRNSLDDSKDRSLRLSWQPESDWRLRSTFPSRLWWFACFSTPPYCCCGTATSGNSPMELEGQSRKSD